MFPTLRPGRSRHGRDHVPTSPVAGCKVGSCATWASPTPAVWLHVVQAPSAGPGQGDGKGAGGVWAARGESARALGIMTADEATAMPGLSFWTHASALGCSGLAAHTGFQIHDSLGCDIHAVLPILESQSLPQSFVVNQSNQMEQIMPESKGTLPFYFFKHPYL